MSNAAPAPLSASAKPTSLTARLCALRDALLTGLIERDVAIRLALLAALAGEHLLLVGPPGTAKSVLARRLHLAFSKATYFERLLTRFTVPEELFGPLSIKGLEEDRYERQTARYLPTASVAFLDEIFKANSAILNALLTLLNEREFDNGAERVHTPLISVVGASNELADGEELDALFDRFLLRLHVGPVSAESFAALLALRGEGAPRIAAGLALSAEELRGVQAEAVKVEVPGDVVALLLELREWCAGQEIVVSDRRWRKVVKLLQVSAFTNGRSAVSVWDAWLLQHCLWSVPEDREKIYTWYAERVGASEAMNPEHLTRVVAAWEGQLKRDQDSRSQCRDEQGRLVFVRPDKKLTLLQKESTQRTKGTERLFLAPANARTDPYDHYSYRINDRTNGNAGYTLTQLQSLWVDQARFQSWPQKDAYLADESNWLIDTTEYQPHMEPTRQKKAYIAACFREIDDIANEVDAYQKKLDSHISQLESQLRRHLWVTSDFIEPAADSLRKTSSTVKLLVSRMKNLRDGFERLPNENTPFPKIGDPVPVIGLAPNKQK
jgi:MoxR-like ATPase